MKTMTPIEKLTQQYKDSKNGSMDDRLLRRRQYNSVREFCLECNILNVVEIETMEYDVDQENIHIENLRAKIKAVRGGSLNEEETLQVFNKIDELESFEEVCKGLSKLIFNLDNIFIHRERLLKYQKTLKYIQNILMPRNSDFNKLYNDAVNEFNELKSL